MQSVLNQFNISIHRVRELIVLHNSLKTQGTNTLDLSDILRAALVLAVSALDYYIHEVVTLGMLEIYQGQRSEPQSSKQSAFARFQVSLGAARQDRMVAINIDSWLEDEFLQNYGDEFLQQSHTVKSLIQPISDMMLNKLNGNFWLEEEIRKSLGYKSFQQPDKIADGIRLISDKKLWDEVGAQMGKPKSEDIKQIKEQLSFIVERRNKIAHEADIDPSYNIGERWPIDEDMVNDAVNFIEGVVHSIHQVLFCP